MQVILGAGLAGLSLAVAMVRNGVREEIVVVDRRTEFESDRTWCTWADPHTPFLDLARHRWPAWEVVTKGGRARHESRDRPYLAIDSGDFYTAALTVLDAAPQVTLRLDTQVTNVGDGWAQTANDRLEGMVHDGLALTSPALRKIRGQWLTFRAWEVRTERPRFDPGAATLMDFGIAQEKLGVQFVHVLPFAEDHAIVSHTSYARGTTPPHRRERVIRKYLGCEFEVLGQQRGTLPMTAARLPALRSPRTTAIGIAGGALRASSGHSFTRVQAHCEALARAIAAGTEPPARAGSPRRRALDVAMLRMQRLEPEAFPERYRSLLTAMPADTFARLMTDQSTPADELRVVQALPRRAFAGAAWRTVRNFRRTGTAT